MENTEKYADDNSISHTSTILSREDDYKNDEIDDKLFIASKKYRQATSIMREMMTRAKVIQEQGGNAASCDAEYVERQVGRLKELVYDIYSWWVYSMEDEDEDERSTH